MITTIEQRPLQDSECESTEQEYRVEYIGSVYIEAKDEDEAIDKAIHLKETILVLGINEWRAEL